MSEEKRKRDTADQDETVRDLQIDDDQQQSAHVLWKVLDTTATRSGRTPTRQPSQNRKNGSTISSGLACTLKLGLFLTRALRLDHLTAAFFRLSADFLIKHAGEWYFRSHQT